MYTHVYMHLNLGNLGYFMKNLSVIIVLLRALWLIMHKPSTQPPQPVPSWLFAEWCCTLADPYTLRTCIMEITWNQKLHSVTFQAITPERRSIGEILDVCLCRRECIRPAVPHERRKGTFSLVCLHTVNYVCLSVCYTDVTSTHYHSESAPPAMPDCTRARRIWMLSLQNQS